MEKKLPRGQFQIIHGPSKFDLMVSLFEGKKVKMSCDLSDETEKVKNYCTLEVVFIKIALQDKSHESWTGEIYFCDGNCEHQNRIFYYDSNRRTGHVAELVH